MRKPKVQNDPLKSCILTRFDVDRVHLKPQSSHCSGLTLQRPWTLNIATVKVPSTAAVLRISSNLCYSWTTHSFSHELSMTSPVKKQQHYEMLTWLADRLTNRFADWLANRFCGLTGQQIGRLTDQYWPMRLTTELLADERTIRSD